MNFGPRTLRLLIAPAIVAFSSIWSIADPATTQVRPSTQAHLQRAKQLAKSGNWVKAEEEFRIAHQQDPNSADAEVGHAEALVRIGQPFDAELEVQGFLQQHPESVRAHEFYGVVTMQTSGDFLVSEQEFEKCVKLAPRDALAWKSLGDLYVGNARPQDGIVAYKKAAQLLPADPLLIASIADAYSETGEKGTAEEEFAKAIKMTQTAPDSPNARKNAAGVQYLYGQYLFNQSRAKESIAALTSALTYNPRSPVALYSRARAYEAVGDYKQAEADALLSFQLTPKDKEGALLLLDIYRKQHDIEKVQQYADTAQRLVDEEQSRLAFAREIRRLLGNAEDALKKAQYADAIPPYEDLLKKVPTFYEAYFGLGICYSQTGRLPEAEAAFRKYLSFQHVSGDGHAALGILLLEQGRGVDAVPELEQALQIDPTLDEARKALASEYLQQSRVEDAIRTLRSAGASKDPQIKTMLATALMQKGDIIGARHEVRLALALQPDYPEAINLQQQLSNRADGSR